MASAISERMRLFGGRPWFGWRHLLGGLAAHRADRRPCLPATHTSFRRCCRCSPAAKATLRRARPSSLPPRRGLGSRCAVRLQRHLRPMEARQGRWRARARQTLESARIDEARAVAVLTLGW